MSRSRKPNRRRAARCGSRQCTSVPSGKSPQANCEEYAPLIEQAARQNADLVVLGETLTYYGTGKSFAEIAEPMPGPSTEILRCDWPRNTACTSLPACSSATGHLIYNVAVLLGPDGKVTGKYRKVCLPRGEIEPGASRRARNTRCFQPASASWE